MKFILAFVAVVACTLAAPQTSSKDATILKYESENIGVDGYRFAVETSDGLSRVESAELHNVGSEHESIAVKGSISWISPEGTPYNIDFIADENGYQPSGLHFPK